MLSLLPTMGGVTPWQVIEEALARLRPPRNKEWLSAELQARGENVSPQAVGNWKKRGVPGNRFIVLGEILHLTPRQVAGLDPLPWEVAEGWPFPEIDQARFTKLSPTQVGEIQAEVRKLLEKFEREAAERSGKSAGSQAGANQRRAAA
jgi:hypothetical protein